MNDEVVTKAYLRELTAYLLQTFRGKKPRETVRRKLSLGRNQLERWESAEVQISVLDFVDLCEIYGVQAKGVFEKVFQVDSFDAHQLFRNIIGDLTNVELAKKLGWSLSKVQRLSSQSKDFKFWELLYVAHHIRGMLWVTVSHLLDGFAQGPYQENVNRYQQAIKILRSEPLAGVFCDLLSLESYQKLSEHSDEFCAFEIGRSVSEIQDLIGHLLVAGLVKWEGKKLKSHFRPIVTSEMSEEDQKQIMLFNIQRAQRAIESEQLFDFDKALFTYSNMATTEDQFRRIREKLSDFYSAVYQIASEKTQKPPERLMSLQIQFFQHRS